MDQIASPAARDLAHRATRIDFFSQVGTLQPSHGIEPVHSWDACARLNAGDDWIAYITDATNTIHGQLIEFYLKEEAQQWNMVADELDAIFLKPVKRKLESAVPDIKLRGKLVKGVVNLIGLAGIERHYSEMVESDIFLELFGWLEKGHLPCGALEDYPARRYWVF